MSATLMTDAFNLLPEDIQERLVKIAVDFHLKHGVPVVEINRFMVDSLKIYLDYMERKEAEDA